MKKEEFRLATTFPGPDETPATGWVVCPAMAKLPAAQAEILVHLPVCDANGAALAALDGISKPRKNTHLALFAGDPFLHLPTVFRAAKRAGSKRSRRFRRRNSSTAKPRAPLRPPVTGSAPISLSYTRESGGLRHARPRRRSGGGQGAAGRGGNTRGSASRARHAGQARE